MNNFIKNIIATIIGVSIMIFVPFLLIVLFMPKGDPVPSIPSKAILKLTLSGNISEMSSTPNPLQALNLEGSSAGVIEIVESINEASQDEHIKGIYLNVQSISAGFATLQEIRDALVQFKKSGKFVIAYGESYTEAAYFIVSVADKIFLNPIGSLEFNGLLPPRTIKAVLWPNEVSK